MIRTSSIRAAIALLMICEATQAQESKDNDLLCRAFGQKVECPMPPDQRDRQNKSIEILRPASDQLTYEPSRLFCESCLLSYRHYIFAFGITIPNSDKTGFDQQLTDRAALSIRSSFSMSAVKALASRSDTTPVGWTDEDNAICRARAKKPSLILAKPYFDDVEYCLRLISANGLALHDQPIGLFSEFIPRSPLIFRLQSQITIAVTLNPGSPYRQPTNDEIAPYADVLVDLVNVTKNEMAKEIKSRGWIPQSESRLGAISIIGYNAPTSR
jgi:hypothetical protein